MPIYHLLFYIPGKCGPNNSGNRIGTSQACYAIMADKANFKKAQYACWTRSGQLAPVTAATKVSILAVNCHYCHSVKHVCVCELCELHDLHVRVCVSVSVCVSL